MAMRRDVADLRTTFSVEGTDKVVGGAKDVAAGLDAVGAAAARQGAASAASAAAARDAAAAQVAAAKDTADAAARVAKASEDAVGAARQRLDAIRKVSADSVVSERAASQARATERTADLRRELADLDARAEARKAAADKARATMEAAAAASARIAARERAAGLGPDATDDQKRAAGRTYSRADQDASFADTLAVKAGANARKKLDGAEAEGAADRSERERVAARIAAIEAEEAAAVASAKKVSDARVAEARRAFEEAKRIRDQEAAAAQAAVEAQSLAARALADAELRARRELAAEKVQIDRAAARARADAEAAEAAASTEGAVRVAQRRYEQAQKLAADEVRRAKARADDRIYDRRFELQDESAGIDADVATRRRAREAMQARLDAMPKPRPGSDEIRESDLDRRDLEMRLSDQRELDRRADKAAATEKRGIGKDLKNLARDAAEEVRIAREASDEKVRIARRELEEKRRILSEETIAAKTAAAEQAKAEEAAAKQRVRDAVAAARAFRRDQEEVNRLSREAQRVFERIQQRQGVDAAVTTGMSNPGKLRADAAAAAEDYAKKAAALAERSAASQARLSSARGSPEELAALARQEKASLAGSKGAATKAEAQAKVLAEALREVERRLKAVEEEGDRAAASLDKIASSARKAQAQLKGRKEFEADLGRGMRNPRQAEALAAAWAAAYERAVDRVVKAAAEAKAAIAAASGNPEDVARVKAAEAAKVEALQATADRVRQQATRSADVWRDVERSQERSAREAARAQEAAARRSSQAWENALRRVTRIQRSLPTLLGTRNGLATRLSNEGSLSVLGGLAGGVGRVVGSIAGIAGRTLGGVVSTLGTVASLAGRAAGAVLSIGVSAVTAAARMALHLGQAAVSVLGKLAGGALDAAGKVASIARTVVVRTVLVGGGAVAAGAIAGNAAAKKAISETAEQTYELRETLMATRTSTLGYQAIAAGAAAAGVRVKDLNATLQSTKERIERIGENPRMVASFTRLGIITRDIYGRTLDTTSIIQQVMSKIDLLAMPQERAQLLMDVFGSPEEIERIRPLLEKLYGDDGYLAKAMARKQYLGAVFTGLDVTRMRAFEAATSDSKDAWTGLKLAVSRAVAPEVIASMYRMSNLIAANRDRVAVFAKYAYVLAQGLAEVVVKGSKLGDMVYPVNAGARFAKTMLDGAFHARAFAVQAGRLGAELYRAFEGVWRQQHTPDQVFIRARQGAIDFAATVYRIQATVVGLGREMRAAFVGVWRQQGSGDAGMIQARRGVIAFAEGVYFAQRAVRDTFPFFVELWAAARGKDAQVTRFPWLITLRTGLEEAARFAREAWSTIRGDTGAVTEFPLLLRIRTGVIDAFTATKQFAIEAWAAITGRNVDYPRFEWLFGLRDKIVSVVADAKAQWADLVGVWNGFDPETTLGAKFAGMLAMADKARKAWEDIKLVFDDTPDSQQKFNFPWIRDLARDVEAFAARVKGAWDTFKGFYDFFDRSIQRMTFGKLDLATVALTTGLLTLFGVTRTVIGGLKALGLAGAALRGLLGRTATVAAGGAGASGGLAGALTRAGTAAENSGRAAERSAGLWSRLSSSIGGVARNLAANPGIWTLLGIGGGIAGDMVGRNADPENGTGRGWAVAGGILQGAGTGLALGAMTGNPWVAGGAAIAGGIYGAFSSSADYHARRMEALKAKLREQGHGDLAEKISVPAATEGNAGTGTVTEGMTADERSAFGDADREVGRAEEGMRQALAPVGQDIAAIRELVQRGATLGPSGSGAAVADGVPAARYPEPPSDAAVAAASRAAAAARSSSTERYLAAEQGLRSGMAGIMANDPMRSVQPAPAPTPAPPGADVMGRQSALGGESAMFVIRTSDGKDRAVRGRLADVTAIRDELSRGVAPPTWAVS